MLGRPVDLVTASALLDLVSDDWLDRLARATVAPRLLVYAALTYDGRVMFEPADPFDAEMIAAVNRHQRGDKGFGPALGPNAARGGDRAVRSARLRGRPGRLGLGSRPAKTSKFKAILTGWAAAANELGDRDPAEIRRWLERRRSTSVPAARRFQSVTSTSSQVPPAPVERRDHSRTTLRHRADGFVSAGAARARGGRSVRARSPAGRRRG